MNRYRVGASDLPYARELRANLAAGTYYHSPGLQRVLNVLRSGPKAGKLVLVEKQPFRRWVLARLPARRGEPVRELEGQEFTDLVEAEWTVFRMRWREHTGTELEV
jgi:hypothetical protein